MIAKFFMERRLKCSCFVRKKSIF